MRSIWAKNCPSIREEIPVAQAWRHAFRTRPRVVLQLVAQMLRIGGKISAFRIRVRQQRMSRQGGRRKRLGRVENEDPFQTGRGKKKNHMPPGKERGGLPRGQN